MIHLKTCYFAGNQRALNRVYTPDRQELHHLGERFSFLHGPSINADLCLFYDGRRAMCRCDRLSLIQNHENNDMPPSISSGTYLVEVVGMKRNARRSGMITKLSKSSLTLITSLSCVSSGFFRGSHVRMSSVFMYYFAKSAVVWCFWSLINAFVDGFHRLKDYFRFSLRIGPGGMWWCLVPPLSTE